jgi:hypothetical protein
MVDETDSLVRFPGFLAIAAVLHSGQPRYAHCCTDHGGRFWSRRCIHRLLPPAGVGSSKHELNVFAPLPLATATDRPTPPRINSASLVCFPR